MPSREFDLTPAATAGPRVALRTHGSSQAAVTAGARKGRLNGLGAALLRLQRRHGNRFVLRLVEQAHIAPVSQSRLRITRADDPREREADRLAQAVTAGTTPIADRATDRAPAIQRLSDAADGPLNAGVQQAIERARGSGRPLSERVREPLERAFGADFERVRLHTGAQADGLGRVLQARAFTTGQDIFFRRGEYDPVSTRGQYTLAHELTHVVQQRGRPMAVQCLRRYDATLAVNARLRQNGTVLHEVESGTPITIDLDSVSTEAGPDGDGSYRVYKLLSVNGKKVSAQGWWLREDWFDLVEAEPKPADPGAGFILSAALLSGGSDQDQQPSPYVHNLVIEFGSPRVKLDEMIKGGSTALAAKLNSLAPYKLTKKNMPPFENAQVVSVTGSGVAEDSFDQHALTNVKAALRTLRAASAFGPTRLYLRGHGEPTTQTLGGWSAQAVWSFLVKCGIKGMTIDVISVTGCQLALTPDEVTRKMGAEWRESRERGMAPLTTKEQQLYEARYRARKEKVYDPAGPTKMTASFPAQLTGKAHRSLANNPLVYGRTEYVLVTGGRKETSYAASGTYSDLASKGDFTKRRYRWDPIQKKVVWDWVS